VFSKLAPLGSAGRHPATSPAYPIYLPAIRLYVLFCCLHLGQYCLAVLPFQWCYYCVQSFCSFLLIIANVNLLRNVHFSLIFLDPLLTFPKEVFCVIYFQVLDFIRRHIGSATPLIAGNSIYTDLLFLKVSKRKKLP
jgi:hypothetical protein